MTLPVDIDLDGATVAYMSFGQGEEEEKFSVPISRLTLSDNVATAFLSQEETLKLDARVKTEIQLRWVKAGVAYGTKIVKVPTDAIVKDGVI